MDDSEYFNDRLQSMGQWYKTLSAHQRQKTLNYLIDTSEPSDLFELSARLHKLLKRDFVSQLPPELSTRILQYLTLSDIGVCCLVSSVWCHIINSSTKLWKEMCLAENIVIRTEDKFQDALFYKKLLLNCKVRMCNLDKELEKMTLLGHNDRVMAVAYHNGKIATGSDDHTVRIWSGKTGACLKILRTHTVATLQFDDDCLITGSYDSTAASWNLKDGGKRNKEFIGHISAVFCLDFNVEHDILVTGSADGTVKLWSLSQGTLFQTLTHPDLENHWVTQVCLCFKDPIVPLIFDGETQDNIYFVVSTNKEEFVLHKLELTKHKVLGTETMFAPGFGTVTNCGIIHKEDILHCVGVGEVDILGAERPLNFLKIKKYESTCLCNHAITFHYNSIENIRSTHVLGGGKSFTVLLHNEVYADCCLDIYRSRYSWYQDSVLSQKQSSLTILRRLELPSDCRLTACCLGERKWLDGLDGVNDAGVFLVVALKDHSVCVYKWKPSKLLASNLDEETQ